MPVTLIDVTPVIDVDPVCTLIELQLHRPMLVGTVNFTVRRMVALQNQWFWVPESIQVSHREDADLRLYGGDKFAGRRSLATMMWHNHHIAFKA
jgi:hypothetical protein